MPIGVQISLFDTSDPNNMSRLDNKILGGAGSHSLIVPDAHAGVVIDAHAFYFDPSRKLVGVPVELNSGTDGQSAFSGAVLYKLGDSSLTEVARITHSALGGSAVLSPNYRPYWTPANDIARLYTVDDRLISVSLKGLASHDWDSPTKVLNSVVFAPEAAQTWPSPMERGGGQFD